MRWCYDSLGTHKYVQEHSAVYVFIRAHLTLGGVRHLAYALSHYSVFVLTRSHYLTCSLFDVLITCVHSIAMIYFFYFQRSTAYLPTYVSPRMTNVRPQKPHQKK